MHALGSEFGSAARLSKRPGSVWTCLWGNALKRSPGIIRKSRVSYPGPGFLSSATWPSLPKKHYNGLNQTKPIMRSISIAEESIPKTSNEKHDKLWFNDDCKTAIRSRKAALRKFNLQPSAENLNNFKIHRAKTRRVIKSSKKTTWRNYLN